MDVGSMEAEGDSPPGSFSTLARPSIVQFPARAQVLSCNEARVNALLRPDTRQLLLWTTARRIAGAHGRLRKSREGGAR
jgi:hypothetical protein